MSRRRELIMPATPILALATAGTVGATPTSRMSAASFSARPGPFLGAGQQMVRQVGRVRRIGQVPVVVAGSFFVWAAYRLPVPGCSTPALARGDPCAITLVYLLRRFLFFHFDARFPGNSLTFGWSRCDARATIGVAHAIGLRQVGSESA